MKKSQIRHLVNQYIAENKIHEALDVLTTYAKGLDRYLENELLLQLASLNRNSKDYNNNLISREDFNLAIAKTNYAVTQILERIPDKGNEVLLENSTVESANTKQVILFLTANPTNTSSLRIDEELRKVKDNLAQTTSRDSFQLVSESAVRIATITGAMQKFKPAIVTLLDTLM
ncbi:MAG: hypothetical protein IPN76_29555 [Saprospiraceae bacterium]|nr:hypothetical protein [Saprospiraceae bacterium]